MLEDPEMAEMAREEIAALEAELPELEDELQRLLLPKDPDDVRNAFLEIRAGTGGDESALFAGDLLRMYTRYAERQGWRTEIVSESPGEVGGYKEVVIRVVGEGVYGKLKFESGGHRVQRVPATETQGRIHTSACTVAVLPEPDEAQAIQINPADLRIDTYRASGAGGQHVNKTDSAVRITHLPTGIVAECQDDRCQHRNKAKAMQVLAARIQEKERSERAAKEAATRKGLIGSGDRSDRIRTYNFPQGRLTDHRINLTLYKLQFVMEGDLDDVIEALLLARKAEQLEELEFGLGARLMTLAQALRSGRRAAGWSGSTRSCCCCTRWAGRRRTGPGCWRTTRTRCGQPRRHGFLAPVRAPRRRRTAGLHRRPQGVLRPGPAVDPRVLVPRPDTETLVEWALDVLPRGRRRACSTWAPAAAPSRWPSSSTRPAARRGGAWTQRGALDVARRQRPARWGWRWTSARPPGSAARERALRPHRLQPALRRRRRPAPGRPDARAAARPGRRRRRPGRHPRHHRPGARRTCCPAAGCCWSTARTRPRPCAACWRRRACSAVASRRDLAGIERCSGGQWLELG